MIESLLLRGWDIAHGLGASVLCAGVFYACGYAILPRRWRDALGPGESPALVGAAVYVLLCWFGVMRGVPVTRTALAFGGVVLVMAAAKWLRWDKRDPRVALGGDGLAWLAGFALLYVLVYSFTLPPVTKDFLPLAWTGNVDLLTYIGHTHYLQRLGTSNIVGASYMNYVYYQTPAVFYLLAWLSLLFGQDPLTAAMPAAFALSALIGLMAARISRSVFGLSRGAALAIGCALVCGPFFRYIAGAYFLSTLMATPVVLYLLWTTVSYRPSRFVDAGAILRFGSTQILLLFIYPFLLLAGLLAQAAAMGGMLLAGCQSDGSGRSHAAVSAGRTACAALIPLALLGVGLWPRFVWSLDMIRSLSRVGVAGWPLDLISPLAMLGWPGTNNEHIQVEDPSRHVWALAVFCAIGVALGAIYWWRLRRETSPAERTIAALAGGAFVMYAAYFLRVGPSYQQWKFASYSVLPLSFVAYAAGWRALQALTEGRATPRTRVVVAAMPLVLGAALVAGNLVAHANGDPDLVRFPGSMRTIATVDKLPFFREVAVQMVDDPGDFGVRLALYYLPSKRVHVISSHFRPAETLSFEDISRQRPFMVQSYGCEGVGHGDTIELRDLGCLLLAPPSLAMATPYPFSESFLFVDSDGLSVREPGGRWNNRSSVTLKLTADIRRMQVAQDTFLNLLVTPYTGPGTPQQRLGITWGLDRAAQTTVRSREWISLPVRSTDWTGKWVWTLPVTVDLPDGVPGRLVDSPGGRYEEQRPLALLFESLSMTVKPAGRVVAP